MITKVNIPKEYANRFLKKDSFEFGDKERLVMLYGANGVGKTSLLELISNRYKKLGSNDSIFDENTHNQIIDHTFSNKNPKIFYWRASYDTPLRNGNVVALDNITNTSLMIAESRTSEGEILSYTFKKHLEQIPNDIDVLCIDELDSGLGCHLVHTCMYYLTEWLNNHKNVQCFIGINNFHWVYLHKMVYRMDTGEFQEINDYKEFWDLTKKISLQIFVKKRCGSDEN